MNTETTSGAVRYLDRDGGRIAYDVQGPDGAPLVLCVPGMGDLRSTFRHTVPALLGAGYRVATMDLRGHGDSDATFDRLEDVATASDIVALIEKLGGPAAVVGNSMGVASSVIAAADRPDLVTGLVMLAAFVRDQPASPVLDVAMRLALLRPWGLSAWLGWYDTLNPGPRPADYAEHRAEIKKSMRRPAYWRAFVRLTRQLTHAPAAARLDDVRAPALVVMGSKDKDFKDPAAEARYIAERIEARTLVVDGAGHYPMVQQPDVVNAAVLGFLADVLPAGSAGSAGSAGA